MDKSGVQHTPYSEWLDRAQRNGYSAVWLPLREEYTEKVDEAKLWSWFKSFDGSTFDISAYIFAFIDSPSDNYFTPFYKEYFLQMLWQYKDITDDDTYRQVVIDPFNRRLKALAEKKGAKFTKSHDLHEVVHSAAALGTNLYELLATPALDSW